MKAVIQRVVEASVTVDDTTKGRIDFGLLVYLGVAHDDEKNDADWLAEKIPNLRIFDDSEGKMNLSLFDIVNQQNDKVNDIFVNQKHGIVNKDYVNHESNMVNKIFVNGNISEVNKKSIGILAISQFTLLGDARKGRRPSWAKAAPPEKARELYLYFMEKIRQNGLHCESGEFQARMKVSYTNEGPVTILLDSKENR